MAGALSSAAATRIVVASLVGGKGWENTEVQIDSDTESATNDSDNGAGWIGLRKEVVALWCSCEISVLGCKRTNAPGTKFRAMLLTKFGRVKRVDLFRQSEVPVIRPYAPIIQAGSRESQYTSL